MAETQESTPGPISVTVESPEPWQRVIKAKITRGHFDQEYVKKLNQAAKTHQRPGFRKGRTPRAMVEKELGDQVRIETLESLVPKAYMAAILEHKLSPLTDPALENLETPDDGPLTFDLVVEVRPPVEVDDYDGLSIQKREAEVTDEDVNGVLARLRESRAVFDKVERPAGDGDQITLDLVPVVGDGEPDEEKIIADQNFILGAETNLPEFNSELAGVSAGETLTVPVSYSAEHPSEGLRGQSITFSCRVKEVAAKVLPELNDVFAAGVEEGKTLLELRQDIRADLLKEAERQIAQELDEQVVQELVRRNIVHLPPSMVKKYIASGLEQWKSRNQQLGRSVTPEQEQEYLEASRPHAEKALKGMMLLEAVRQKEEIKVTDKDVDDRIEEIASENGFAVDRYREFVKSEAKEKERLEFDLLERRTYDFLLSRGEIHQVAADTDVFAEEES